MTPVTRFEDLRAWQQARELLRLTREVTASPEFNQHWALRNQLNRAANSVMANIAEGFNRFGTGEFCQFLSIAKGSCGETQSHLYAAVDGQFIDAATFDRLYGQARLVMSLITRLRSAVKTHNRTGKPTRTTPARRT